MGTRGLDYFLSRAELVKKDAVTDLKGIRLGIDGTYWLRRLLNLKDPFHTCLGKVIPGQLLSNVQRDLSFYESLAIQPIFVFPSLPVLRTELSYTFTDDATNMRNQGWEQYLTGETSAAQYSFESSKSFSLPELASFVIQYLITNNIVVVRAPYAAIPQLIYFKQSNIVHAVLAGSEIICYNIDKWITYISHTQFSWIYRPEVLAKMNLTSEQLLDTCLLCGIDSPTFPPIIPDRDQTHYNVFENAIHQIQTSGNGYTAISMAIQSSRQNLHSYLAHYIRCYAFWYFNPVYTKQGLKPINEITAKASDVAVHPLPKNAHLIFGFKLQNHLLHALCYSLLNPHLLFQLSSGIVLEAPPLCNGNLEYKEFLTLFHINRGFTFDILKQYMSTNHPSNLYFWYDPKSPYSIKAQDTSFKHPMLNTLTSVNVLKSVSTSLKFKNQDINISILFKPKSHSAVKPTPSDVINNAQLRLLIVLGYINIDGESNTSLGQCLATRLENSSKDVNAEGLLIVIELLRLEQLHGHDYNQVFPVKPSDDVRPFIQLITRTCSIINLHHRDAVWNGPLNRNILQFNSILKLIVKGIKQWNEVILLDYLQREWNTQKSKQGIFGLTKVATQMLFNRDVDCTMGVLMTCYLTSKGGFEQMCDVHAELSRGIQFWFTVIIVNIGHIYDG
eukprot:NODE_59_length_25653_cov_0.289622.p1 type:complete len:672 gc:universal NODE_59_length_25653_cov_0.289622:2870-4885(+)